MQTFLEILLAITIIFPHFLLINYVIYIINKSPSKSRIGGLYLSKKRLWLIIIYEILLFSLLKYANKDNPDGFLYNSHLAFPKGIIPYEWLLGKYSKFLQDNFQDVIIIVMNFTLDYIFFFFSQ
ncbi:hypothetical protein BWI93_01305 [Siphonobacter sp. BAB-5385]|uniref:hypothetical protein n=1 Tax=Siphonobacter sp. BAB-5385 TaxID=1864822 RepID=UPI000B9DE288|nr:hypothetical protein [Siphonobacter sp. BAB-5385]OZI09932.1 hypothetical protein BWI93_01305 [Siphonobacter sp. BAB-5385]